MAPTSSAMVPVESKISGLSRGTAQLVSGIDIRTLPLCPEEAFVLSRIDGTSSEAEIAAATNLSDDDLERVLSRLAALGAIRFSLAVAQSSRPPQSAQALTSHSGAYRIAPIVEVMESPVTPRRAAAAAADSAADALAEEVDLSPEQRRDWLALYQRLSSISHYEVLGLEQAADSKAVRAQYYALVRVFHPDRYFGKNLGSFRPRLARIFARLTEAYEALSRPGPRAEYDRYLDARGRTVTFERSLFDPVRQAAEVAAALARIEAEALAHESMVPPAAELKEPASGSVMPPSLSGTRVRQSLAPPSEGERRRTLARRLGHSSLPPRASPSMPAPSPAEQARNELKFRYEARLQRARLEQLNGYLELAGQAESRNDLAAAANALRIACTLAPEDNQLASRLAELEARASAELWQAYAERAQYAAVEGRHEEAAECFERAALGRPSAIFLERAAFHWLKAGVDLKRASQLAQRAAALAPQRSECRVVLAQIYLAADLRESALAEFERALALDPGRPLIKDWIARVKRGER